MNELPNQANSEDDGQKRTSVEPGILVRSNEYCTNLMDRWIPERLLSDPEIARRARLVSRFGWLGSFFGFVFAAFYILIGHKWGATIVVLCSSSFAITPMVMNWRKAIEPAVHLLLLTLTLGFTALCFVEGGLHGHAMAWLVSIPLCALLLAGKKAGARWAVIAFVTAAVIAVVDLAGVEVPVLYDHRWNSVVSAAGYLALVLFMFMLGVIFENGRTRAFAKMEEALAKLAVSNERLQHLNNEKNEFLGIAAHDLKNPLTVIAGSAELVTMTKDQKQITKLAGNIGAAATRMRALITNLLDVNAIEQGKFTSAVERCDICGLMQQSVDDNLTAANRKGIAIRVGLTEGLCAKADRAATLQILDNLISNALKYSPPNTTVHVHTLPEKDFVIATVRDEGPGITDADQKRLFQKFTRLTARPTGGESSTGLGLAIAKRLAEAMNGTVQCHSVPGSGATFTLRLPLWPADQKNMKPEPAAKPPATRSANMPMPMVTLQK